MKTKGEKMYCESRDMEGNLLKHQLTHQSLVHLVGYTRNYPFWTGIEVTPSEKTVKLIGKIHTKTAIFKTDSVFKQYCKVLEDHFSIEIL